RHRGAASGHRRQVKRDRVGPLARRSEAIIEGPPPSMSMSAGDLSEVFDPVAYGERAAATYREKRPLYAEFAHCLKKLLQEALASSDVKTQTIEARAKTIDSFARKAGTPFHLDPSRPKYENPLEQIKDMAGVRVITYLPNAVEEVGDAIRAEFDVVELDDKSE